MSVNKDNPDSDNSETEGSPKTCSTVPPEASSSVAQEIGTEVDPETSPENSQEKPLHSVPATADLLEAVAMRMPFGRFKGERLIDLPEPYVVWFKGQGFPAGMLGQRMALVYELKLNGLEKLIRPMLDENS